MGLKHPMDERVQAVIIILLDREVPLEFCQFCKMAETVNYTQYQTTELNPVQICTSGHSGSTEEHVETGFVAI